MPLGSGLVENTATSFAVVQKTADSRLGAKVFNSKGREKIEATFSFCSRKTQSVP